MDGYIKRAREAVSENVKIAIERCQDIAEKHCIESYWVIEQFKQEFNKAVNQE